MPQATENERVNRYATRSNLNRLKAAAGMKNSNRTKSRFAFANRKPLNPNAPPFIPSGTGAATMRRASRRHRKSRRSSRR